MDVDVEEVSQEVAMDEGLHDVPFREAILDIMEEDAYDRG